MKPSLYDLRLGELAVIETAVVLFRARFRKRRAGANGGVTLRRKLVKSQYKLRDNGPADTARKPLYRQPPGNNGPLGQ